MVLSITKYLGSFTKSLAFLTVVLVLFTGCKKQDEATTPLKSKMVGKWQIAKVETAISGSTPTTVNGASNDYVDFKSGEDDIVEINLTSSLQSGTYSVTVGNSFFISIGGKLNTCTPTVIEDNKFEFTATEDQSSPTIVKKYFLTR